MNSNLYPLPGLDGTNPLAFLASLGVLRLLTLARPELEPQLSWDKNSQLPIIKLRDVLTQDEVSQILWSSLVGGTDDCGAGLKAREMLSSRQNQRDAAEKEMKKDKSLSSADRKKRLDAYDAELSELQIRWLGLAAPHLNFGLDTKFQMDVYRSWELAAKDLSASNRTRADVIASLCSSAHGDEEGFAADTDFRTVRGAGHQHFLGIMVNQLIELQPQHVHKTLFAPWQYDDPLEALSLRWDPLDDVRYALRWGNPSGDPLRKKQGNMIAANTLAAAALPCFPVVPIDDGVATTGFNRINRATCWSWPLWDGFLNLDCVRSVLAHHELQSEEPDHRQLSPMGIFGVFRTERFTQGKFRNFTPAEAV